MRGRLPLAVFVAVGLASLVGCAPGEPLASTATGSVAGTVAYRERIALPPSATVRVRLEDVSLADAPSRVLAETLLVAGGRQVPLAFRLRYRLADIDERNRYAVRAEIRMPDGTLGWTTDTHTPVLTHGGTTEANLLLVRVPLVTGQDGASDRGVTIRAVGTEPFWSLDLTEGETMRLDWVARETVVTTPTPRPVRAGGETRYTARTEAHALDVTVREETCSDGMSDLVYPLAITVVVDGETLTGCGRRP